MKTKIFIYLFAFTALILIFQIVNSSKVVKYQAEIIAEKVARIDTLKVSLENIASKYDNDVYFSLDQNDEAKAFYPDNDPDEIIQWVKDKIYESNTAKGDNPLVIYSVDSRKFLINKILIGITLIITYLIGPLGLFIYWLIRIFYAKSMNLYD